MNSFILFSLLSFTTLIAHSAEECPNIKTQYNIEFRKIPLQYNYQLNSKALQNLSSSKNNQNFPIGLFSSNRRFGINHELSIIKTTVNNKISYCSKLTKLNLILFFNPIIYIATETNNLSCTYKRVHKHELVHYNIELQAIEYINNNIKNFLTNNFDEPVYANNLEQLKEKMNAKNNYTMNYLSILFDNHTLSKHATLDTPQNYIHETNLCSDEENYILSSRIKSQ